MFLAQNIKTLRKGRGLTQNDLADKLNVTYTQVGAYEREKSYPPIDKILIISELFDVNIEVLILRDLSQELDKARPADPAPKSEEEQDVMLRSLNDLLMKRVMQMEEELKKLDPERARELGIE